MHNLYPVFLKLGKISCYVIGGGKVAERKIITLLESGAQITVISPEATDLIKQLASEGKITLLKREYKAGDLTNAFLTIAATDSEKVNMEVQKEAAEKCLLFNITDNPDLCNFFVPANIKRGDLQIAVSTSGKVPYFSRRLREFLEKKIPKDTGKILDEMAESREKILVSSDGKESNRQKIKEMLDKTINDFFKRIE